MAKVSKDEARQFMREFDRAYSFMDHDVTIDEVQDYLELPHVRDCSVQRKLDLFQDFVLANGRETDIQL